MNQANTRHYTLAAADLFELLHIATEYPSDALAKGFQEGTLYDDVRSILDELGSTRQSRTNLDGAYAAIGVVDNAAQMLVELRQEYTRLFTHPKMPAVYPYEALFLHTYHKREGMLPRLYASEAALSAQDAYRQAGLTRDRSSGKNLSADHISLEMEFMSILYRMKSEALLAVDATDQYAIKGVCRAQQQIESFAKQHLVTWMELFFSEVEMNTTNSAYQFVGKVGRIAAELLVSNIS